jgi:hypothetical protein
MSTVNHPPDSAPEEVQWRRYSRTCGRSLLVPLLLITLGVIFLLAAYHVIPAHSAWQFFWPFIFIYLGVGMLGRGRAGMGAIFIVVGVALIGAPMGWWQFDSAKLWPLILILIGIAMLTGGWESRRWRYERWHARRYGRGRWSAPEADASGAASSAAAGAPPDASARIDALAFFGGFQRRITAQNFVGGRVTAIMGGFQLDLRRAQIAADTAVLDLTAILGGGEIIVPTSWIIDNQAQGLLGGYSDETHQDPPQPGAKRLIIQGVSVFGGVAIKN